MTTITNQVDQLVRARLAQGIHVLTETDTYRQHCLREHPLVCRQTERYTTTYVLHDEPCGCPPQAHVDEPEVDEGTCCFMIQPIGAECMFCGEVVV